MIENIESLVESLFSLLRKGGIKFYVISAVLHAIESPQDAAKYISIAAFLNEGLLEREVPEFFHTIDTALALSMDLSEYRSQILNSIAAALSRGRLKNRVETNMLFELTRTLQEEDLRMLYQYIFSREIGYILAKPELADGKIHSTLLHQILTRGMDNLALDFIISLENKSLIFQNDSNGQTPVILADENRCPLSFNLLQNLREFRERVGL